VTNQNDQDAQNRDKNEMRFMWIGSAAVIILILALMGYNMWAHPNAGSEPSELSSQSRSEQSK
jgi:hypothetical protein